MDERSRCSMMSREEEVAPILGMVHDRVLIPDVALICCCRASALVLTARVVLSMVSCNTRLCRMEIAGINVAEHRRLTQCLGNEIAVPRHASLRLTG